MQLSTRKTALYYYDYVFIKEIRRRQRTTMQGLPVGSGPKRSRCARGTCPITRMNGRAWKGREGPRTKKNRPGPVVWW